MGNTTFSGSVRSENGFSVISKAAGTGVETTSFTLDGKGVQVTPVVLADANTTLTAADNIGRTNVIPDVGGNRVYKLPTPVAGYYVNFVYGGAAADASNPVIQTVSTDNSVFFKGSVTHLDTTADENVAAVLSNGSSNSKLTLNVPSGIDLHFLAYSATVWYVWGSVTAATVPAFADQ